MNPEFSFLSGTIIDEDNDCNLRQICRIFNIEEDTVLEMVAEGVVSPSGTTPGEWRFDYIAVQRITKTIRLQRDLHINLPGCALALDLLEELETLRRLQRLG